MMVAEKKPMSGGRNELPVPNTEKGGKRDVLRKKCDRNDFLGRRE